MKYNYGNWGENKCSFKITYGAGFTLRSDTGRAPVIIIQPVPQHQVQHVQAKTFLCLVFPEASSQLTENAWHEDKAWMQVTWIQHLVSSAHFGIRYRLACCGSGQGNEEAAGQELKHLAKAVSNWGTQLLFCTTDVLAWRLRPFCRCTLG